ncbi:MAG TPA: hypothetical protein GX012_05230 [Acholeplasma sp.]|nr:hypothetical protein [Acholeplasma sp.]
MNNYYFSYFIIKFSFIFWLNDYYKATTDVNDYLTSTDKIEIFNDENNYLTFKPENPTSAIIFYPGGKVDSLAYAPLMFELAENGFLTILIKMPFNLAVFDINAASKVRDLYPNINNWYLSGHSLGGSMAASHLANNSDKYQGLILLGSYSTKDLSNLDIKTLSIYGENDNVLNKANYNKYITNLPNLEELVIEGGNHANFGYYGNQKGDGISIITRQEQIKLTIDFIVNNIKK